MEVLLKKDKSKVPANIGPTRHRWKKNKEERKIKIHHKTSQQTEKKEKNTKDMTTLNK